MVTARYVLAIAVLTGIAGGHTRAAQTKPAPEVLELFRQHCGKCHGTDGTGSPARSVFPDIPNFTQAAWQARHSDAQLLASILDGKGQDMPSMRKKLTDQQAKSLVEHIRSFAAGKKSGSQQPESRFEIELQRLQKEWDRLQHEWEALAKHAAHGAAAKPSPSAKQNASRASTGKSPKDGQPQGEHCRRRNGADGTGSVRSISADFAGTRRVKPFWNEVLGTEY
jgi:mono/diheme cytochrome c family protein